MISEIANVVDADFWNELRNITVQFIKPKIDLSILFTGVKITEIIIEYYSYKHCEFRDFYAKSIAMDYILKCIELGIKVRLDYNVKEMTDKYNELCEKQNKENLAQEYDLPLIPSLSKFEILINTLIQKSSEFELISSMKRLLEEADNSLKDAFAYRDLIREDIIVMFCWEHNQEKHTVSFIQDKNGYFAVKNIVKRNGSCIGEKDYDDLKEILKGVAILKNRSYYYHFDALTQKNIMDIPF